MVYKRFLTALLSFWILFLNVFSIPVEAGNSIGVGGKDNFFISENIQLSSPVSVESQKPVAETAKSNNKTGLFYFPESTQLYQQKNYKIQFSRALLAQNSSHCSIFIKNCQLRN